MPNELLTDPDTRTPAERPESGEWKRLRALLLGRERASLDALAGRVGDRESLARSVAGILPDAVALRAQHDSALTGVLAPLIEDSLQQSVRNNPAPLIEALYPIMGSAIRRSLTETLAELLHVFNAAVEQSLSARALKWRWDAWRTGQTYASVVLLHTQIYRVEQMFLIHRNTGLLLHHVRAEEIVSQDPDMVAGMLTAIRQFVADSFQLNHEDGVDSIRLGDLIMQVRVGPQAVLAAVVRGNPPGSLSVRLTETLERVHASHGAALTGYSGDPAPFDDVGGLLSSCLCAQTRTETAPPRWRSFALLATLTVALTTWMVHQHQMTREWNRVISDVTDEPGFVVLEAGTEGSHRLRGLRDPLARDPVQVLGVARIERFGIQLDFKPFLSMEPRFLLARAERLLHPPATVKLVLDDGVLRATGAANLLWVHQATERAPLIEGIRVFDASAITPSDTTEFEQARRALGAVTVYFPMGSAVLPVTEQKVLESLDPVLTRFRNAAAALPLDYVVEVVGRADAPGTTAYNLRLSQDRANAVGDFLVAHGLPRARVLTRGVGAADAVPGDAADAAMTPSRKVPAGLERRVNIGIALRDPSALDGGTP